MDKSKRCLDKHLSTIPDEPQVLGYIAQRRADSNSFLSCEIMSIPTGTGHRKWKCLVIQNCSAEEVLVSLTALPECSDSERYYKVPR